MEVDKITAAARLLDEAIRGFLRGDEPLSVHVQAFSAVRVTADLRKGRGLGQSAFDDFLKKEGAQAFWKAFYSVNSFLKHADKDPEETINDDGIPGLNELAIILAIENLRVLGMPSSTSFWRLYVQCRFFMEHPAAVVFMHPGGAEQWEAVRGLWGQIDHGYVVQISRDPEGHQETLDALSALIQKMSAQQDQAQNQAAL